VQENELTESARWKTILYQFVDLVFPRTCATCNESVPPFAGLCSNCLAKVRYLFSPLCVRCGTHFPFAAGDNHTCGDCLRQPPPFSKVRSVCSYAPPASTLLQSLKYRADRTSLCALTQIMEGYDLEPFASCDVVIPVPLFPKRLRRRGLNQSLLLAHLLFPQKKGAIDPDILVRVRDTVPQTGLDGNQRRINLKAAFAVRRKEQLAGKSICLVDDVFTTGSTLRECAKTLKRSGAGVIQAVTLARVIENHFQDRSPDNVDDLLRSKADL